MNQTTTLIDTACRDDLLSSFTNSSDMPPVGFDLQEILFTYPAPSDFSGEYVEEYYDFYVDPLYNTVRVESETVVQPKPVPQPAPSPVASSGVSKRDVSKKDDVLRIRREKNRLAAERCRARKSNLIMTLQAECDQLRCERDRLRAENQVFLDLLTRAGLIRSYQ